ncbi:hypothetical protein StoSoilA2_26030 [Arthrobacter sp. StoSoilA2]|nr:hypothetical protein StoSoilA2_26030 [Arthrobacter sp. StoSoilA2]
MDEAVTEITAGKMRNMGEACTAANRVLVHERIAEELRGKLAERFASFRVGNGLEEGTEIGPMIDQTSVERIQSLVKDAVTRGAEFRVGGTIPEGPGSFYPPPCWRT